MRWTSEARSDYAALFLLEGRTHIRINETVTEIEAGSALLLEPAQAASATGANVEYLTLTLSPSYLLDIAARTRMVSAQAQVTFRLNLIEADDRLNRLPLDIAEELSQAEAGQEMVIAALVEQLVIHLLRRYANVRRSDELELSRVGLVDRRIRRAVELMHSHLAEDLPLEELASAAYLSPFHFSRLFKKLTGASPHAYLATLRARRAQALLAETDLSVTEIGSRVGYSSSSHFTKAFRHATGLTPRAFRAAVIRS
ncbi:MAG TPA: helix-turn-helix domain-containing protein [Pyrinomonadaceae bacterium]|nr:helix-turn-helix domain-containing protein [Pyrinomonadaceae bacterium]